MTTSFKDAVLLGLSRALHVETEEERLARETIALMTEDPVERSARELSLTLPFDYRTCLTVVYRVGVDHATAILTRSAREGVSPFYLVGLLEEGRYMRRKTIVPPTRVEK